MKALVKYAHGVGKVEIREVPGPKIKPDEVLVEVKAAGICGTDIHIYHGRFPCWPPVILGHEFSGEIVEKGKNVLGFDVGDRVTGEPHIGACGNCYNCRQGHMEVCMAKRSPGWGIDGAFTRYIKFPPTLLHKVPENISYEEAAAMEPTAAVYQALFLRGMMKPSDFAVIFGPGFSGILCALMANAVAPGRVVLVGRSTSAIRLKAARNLPCGYVLNSDEENPLEKVMDMTGEIGADIVIDTVGSEKVINQAFSLIRRRGRIVVFGFSKEETSQIAWKKAMSKAGDISFSLSSSFDAWRGSVSMFKAGRINIKSILTTGIPLDNWKETFERIEKKEIIKAIMRP